MKVAITGASGLVGSALVPELRSNGHDVVRFVRRSPAAEDERRWDPAARQLDPADLADVDAVVHLAGANLGRHRWTASYKQVLLGSRVEGTETISTALAAVAGDGRPRSLLSASGVDFYGNPGDRPVDESSEPTGTSFLAELCAAWEGATAPAQAAGVRVVRFRSGLVISADADLLSRTLWLFKLGLGGRLGSGRQYWPVISLADHVSAIRFLLTDASDVSGPVNLTGPIPVTNREFTAALGRVLHRPAITFAPGFALKIALGEMAEELILTGVRAIPGVLTDRDFRYRHPSAEAALRWALDRPA